MIVRRFLAWSETAPATARAHGAGALARAYLWGELAGEDAREALIVLTSLLDDPSPLVRRALAEAVSGVNDAPHHIVAALAADQSDVASIVLSRSLALTDAELIDCAALGDIFAQSAIAIRPRVSSPVAAALAEIGGREAVIALTVNVGADLPEFSMRRIVQRFGDDGEVREALLGRQGLSIALRHDLVCAAANDLSRFVASCAWLTPERAERVTAEARDRAVVAMAAEAGPASIRTLATHLRASGTLTAALVLRSLLTGRLGLFEAVMAELGEVSPARVAGWTRETGGTGFAALYKKAEMPPALLPTFREAVAAAREAGGSPAGAPGRLSLPIVERVLAAREPRREHESPKVLALLRRFHVEAAREEARDRAAELASVPAVEIFRPDEVAITSDRGFDECLEAPDGALAADLSAADLREAA